MAVIASDHALFLLIAGGMPLLAMRQYPRPNDPVNAAGEAVFVPYISRTRTYLMSLAMLTVVFGIVLLAWRFSGREWRMIGLGAGDGPHPAPAQAVAAIAAVIAIVAVGAAARSDRARKWLHPLVRDSLTGALGQILPRTSRELALFSLVCLPAALCEEVMFRGFLVWYFGVVMPMPAAIAVAAVVFGACHAYQGPPGMARTAAVALLFSLLYWMTGSLWLAVGVHSMINIASASLAYLYIHEVG